MTHKRHESNESMHENKILWGLRISERIKNACRITALKMRIPVGHFVSFIIYSWFRENNELLENEQDIKELEEKTGWHIVLLTFNQGVFNTYRNYQ